LDAETLADLIEQSEKTPWGDMSEPRQRMWRGVSRKGPRVLEHIRPVPWTTLLSWDQRHPGERVPTGIREIWEYGGRTLGEYSISAWDLSPEQLWRGGYSGITGHKVAQEYAYE